MHTTDRPMSWQGRGVGLKCGSMMEHFAVNGLCARMLGFRHHEQATRLHLYGWCALTASKRMDEREGTLETRKFIF